MITVIKHVVCFKIKKEHLDKLQLVKERMYSMKDNIDYIVDLSCGIDFLHSERSYDVILEVTFNNVDDLNRYQKDPYHCEHIKTLMHEIREASIAVDYEF